MMAEASEFQGRFYWKRISLIAAFVIAALGLLIWLGYQFSEVTGFGTSDISTPEGVQSAKKLWDWMELLVIPAMLAGGGLYFTWQRAKSDAAITAEHNRENALQSYLDDMSDLLLEKNLLKSEYDHPVRDVARARTVTTLRTLDGVRRGLLIEFLAAAGLLRGDGISMISSPLEEAALYALDLEKARFPVANLQRANLDFAVLRYSDLYAANLTDASLLRADLRHANLEGAILLGCQFDPESVLPDGATWTPDTDMDRFTDPKHPDFWRSDDPDSPAHREEDGRDDAQP